MNFPNSLFPAHKNNEDESDSASEIATFFNGRTVLVTGATGFLGKVLVEKLLRSCPGIRKIYVVMRPKNGYSIEYRLEAMISAQLFRRLKAEFPERLSKIVPVRGDVASEGIGLSSADSDAVIRDVSVVIHSAATVRFDEPLKTAVLLNMISLRNIITLSRKMENLAVFVHVSTSYCNCDRFVAEEVIYPRKYDPEEIMDMIMNMSCEEAHEITPQLLGKLPNTYIFTKSLNEIYLQKQSLTMPITIVRPSIVISSWKEPFPGWVDGQHGPIQFVGGMYEGIIRSFMIDSTKSADLIPVDIVINIIIAAAWYTAMHRPKTLQIYQAATSAVNPCTWGDFQYWTQYHIMRNPIPDGVWFPRITFHNWMFRHAFEDFSYHYVPAAIIDLHAKFIGKEPIFIGLHQKLQRVLNATEFFFNGEWRFECPNTLQLWNKLCLEDRKRFHMDCRDIDWPTYLSHFVASIRKYHMKKNLTNPRQSRKRIIRMRNFMRFIQYGVSIIIGIPILLLLNCYVLYCISVPEYIVGAAIVVGLMILFEPPSFTGTPTLWTEIIFGEGK